MKRLRLLVLLGAVAVALPLGLTTAKATGGGSYPANWVDIHYDVQYDFNGTIAHADLSVRCKDVGLGVPLGNGHLTGSISQSPPQTPYPVTFTFGVAEAVCDNRTHVVGFSVQGEGLDTGLAKMTVTLTPPPGGGSAVTRTETVNIVAMD
jgi:hypothetical protein